MARKTNAKTRLQRMDDYDFEHLVADLWELQGWTCEVSQASKDAGVDVTATRTDPYTQKNVLQAKRYGPNSSVGAPEIQQYASLKQQIPGTDAVVVVTSNRFTDTAKHRAKDLNVKLIDGDQLVSLLDSHNAHALLDKYDDTHETDTTARAQIDHTIETTITDDWGTARRTESRHAHAEFRDDTSEPTANSTASVTTQNTATTDDAHTGTTTDSEELTGSPSTPKRILRLLISALRLTRNGLTRLSHTALRAGRALNTRTSVFDTLGRPPRWVNARITHIATHRPWGRWLKYTYIGFIALFITGNAALSIGLDIINALALLLAALLFVLIPVLWFFDAWYVSHTTNWNPHPVVLVPLGMILWVVVLPVYAYFRRKALTA